MIWRTTVCIITLCLVSSLKAQENIVSTIDKASNVLKELEYGEQQYTKEFVRKKYGKSPLNLLFRGYKNLISAQDNNSCSFHPSCSNFSLESIKQKGIVKGGLNAFDRLSRCHGMAPEYYQIDVETKKLNDPIESE